MRIFKASLNCFLLLLAVSTFVACDNDDDANPTPQTIVEIAAGDAQFSTLVSALNRTNLTSVLEGAGPFTVFAPTNAAFTALGVDLSTISDEALSDILLYHVFVGQGIQSTDLAEGQTYISTASTSGPGDAALSALVERTGANVKINNAANVTTANLEATNGVIHVIDAVMMPLDVVGHATANSNFTELVSALGAASGDLVPTLQTAGPFTVFAPVNSAFEAIASTTAMLSADQLRDILLYHVVSGNVRSTSIASGEPVPSLNNGATFTINTSDGVVITDGQMNTINVEFTDVQGTNGVIHVIDAVLLP